MYSKNNHGFYLMPKIRSIDVDDLEDFSITKKINKIMKIDWSGRSHNYTKKEIKFLSNVIRTADPLTNGKYQNLFEKSIRTFLEKNIFNFISNIIVRVNCAIM